MKNNKLNDVLKFYAGGIVAFLILAVLSLVFIHSSSVQVVANFFTKNPLLSQNGVVYAQGTQVLFNIGLKWVVFILMLASIIMPTYYIYQIKNKAKNIDLHKYRFIDWLIIGSFMTVVIASVVGVQDIFLLLLIFCFSIMAYYLIWLAINTVNLKKSFELNIYKLGITALFLPWLVVAGYLVFAWVYGDIRTPWYSYALFIIGIIYSGVMAYGYFWHKAKNSKVMLSREEIYPITVNQVFKVLFAVFLIIGLNH